MMAETAYPAGHTERCSGCAFRPGTEANRSLSLAKATICAHAGEPFECHEAAREGELCVGFLELANTLAAKGQFPEPVEWRRQVYAALLEAIAAAEAHPALADAAFTEALWTQMDAIAGRQPEGAA